MTQNSLKNILKKHGVTEYIPSKEKFNPNLHEAILNYEDNKLPKGTVGKVLENGFKIGDRVLRPAKVKINYILLNIGRSSQ